MDDKTRKALVACIDALTPANTEEEHDAFNRATDALIEARLTAVSKPAPTPPALFPMSQLHVEAALCLWEDFLLLTSGVGVIDQKGSLATLGEASYRKQADRMRQDHGTAVMRLAIMQLAPACDAAWSALTEDEKEQAAPFDWGFVPAFLRECIEDGRLQVAIENQYRKEGEQVRV